MSATIDSTPAADGFRMPGEFEPHDGCWMAWPERPDNWRLGAGAGAGGLRRGGRGDRRLRAGDDGGLRRPARALPRAALAGGPGGRDRHRRRLDARHRARPSSSTARGERRGVDWRFNAWGGLEGGLYSPWDRDDRVAAKVLEIEGADRYRAPLVLEGGSIHVDGEGTVLTTEECLLNPNRNPELSQRADRAGAARLPRRREGRSGSGAASSRTRPTATSTTSPASPGPGVVLLTWSDDESDPQHAISRDALRAARGGDRRPRPLARGGHACPPPGRCSTTAEEAAGVEPRRGHPAAPRPATGSPPPTSTSTSPTRGW